MIKTMFGKFVGLVVCILLSTIGSSFAANYYVATDGDDNNSGQQGAPFRTLLHAMDAMNPGDYTFIMPGDYSTGSRLTIEDFHGNESNLLHVFAYDINDKPHFRSGVMIRRTSYVHFKGFEISETIIRVDGEAAQHNIFENFDVHHVPDAMGMSFQNRTNNNKVLNSDFHHNVLFGNSNADGLVFWGNTGGDNGPYGNYVFGCRAYFNNDDGFDTWWSNGSTTFENCWSFGNGKDDSFNDISGDGNGFKLGQGTNNRPTLINCLAWKNKTRGFDENSNQAGGITIYNSTGWDNGVRNFGFFSEPNSDVIRNCVSYGGGGASTPPQYATADFNSWDLGLNVTSNDFVTLDFSVNQGSRQSDGSLPVSDFLRLKETSVFIDRGIDVGLAYTGAAPDLGAYEYQATSAVQDNPERELAMLRQNVPNPFNPITEIRFLLSVADYVALDIYDAKGAHVVTLIHENRPAGPNAVSWDGVDDGGNPVSAGVYMYRLQANGRTEVRRMTLVK